MDTRNCDIAELATAHPLDQNNAMRPGDRLCELTVTCLGTGFLEAYIEHDNDSPPSNQRIDKFGMQGAVSV